jgi:hypothetical protein
VALALEHVDRSPAPLARGRGERAGLAVWVAVVAVGLAWGTFSVRHADVGLHAAPFKGHWAWHGGGQLLPAAVLGTAVAVRGPQLAARLTWRRLQVVTALVATGWAVALAAGDGWSRLTAPLATRHEYEPFAATIGGLGGLGDFLSTYVERLGDRPIHVQGHPPGPVVLAWALDHLGLAGAGWLAAVAVGAWGVAVAAALTVARRLAGEHAARRAAPALAVLPAAIWAGTSVDPVFAALVAVAIALAVVAATRSGSPCTPRWRTSAVALGAGAVFGLSLLSSYGAVPLGLVGVVAVAVAAPSWADAARVLALVGVAVLAMVVLAGVAGFWWPDGLAATRAAYWDGLGSERPGLYLTLVGNPAALAVALGPATVAGLGATAAALTRRTPLTPDGGPIPTALAARGSTHGLAALVRRTRSTSLTPDGRPIPVALRSHGLALVVGAALVAVTVADLSQLARGEVERIWLPFIPWLALAAPGDRRCWLAAQVGLALVLQSFLASPW